MSDPSTKKADGASVQRGVMPALVSVILGLAIAIFGMARERWHLMTFGASTLNFGLGFLWCYWRHIERNNNQYTTASRILDKNNPRTNTV